MKRTATPSQPAPIDPASLTITPYLDILSDGGDGNQVITRPIPAGGTMETWAISQDADTPELTGQVVLFDGGDASVPAYLESELPEELDDVLRSEGTALCATWHVSATLDNGQNQSFGFYFERARAEQALRVIQGMAQTQRDLALGSQERAPKEDTLKEDAPRMFTVYAKSTGGDPDFINDPQKDTFSCLWEADRRARELALSSDYGSGRAWVCDNPFNQGVVLAYFEEDHGELRFEEPEGYYAELLAKGSARYVEADYVSEWDGGTRIATPCVVDLQTGFVRTETSRDAQADQVDVFEREYVVDNFGGEHLVVCTEDGNYQLEDLPALKLALNTELDVTAQP